MSSLDGGRSPRCYVADVSVGSFASQLSPAKIQRWVAVLRKRPISKPSYTQDKVVLLCNQRSTTIQDNAKFLPPAPRRIPWNKGKLIGAKPPPRQKHVWAIRTKLQIDRRTRDLALFNLAIDSKLRGCDVVALKVEDVAPNGYSSDRATRPAEKDWATRPV